MVTKELERAIWRVVIRMLIHPEFREAVQDNDTAVLSTYEPWVYLEENHPKNARAIRSSAASLENVKISDLPEWLQEKLKLDSVYNGWDADISPVNPPP